MRDQPETHTRLEASEPDSAWLVIAEAVPFVELSTSNPASIRRTIRRWISTQALPARHATANEIAALLAAGRVRGIPPEGYIYLIHRDDLLAYERHRRMNKHE